METRFPHMSTSTVLAEYRRNLSQFRLWPGIQRYVFALDPAILICGADNATASTALVSLVTLGGRVRSVLTGSRSREQIIKKEIDSYLKWSEVDGGYRHKTFLPIIAVVAGKPGQRIGDISRIMTDQLNFLADQHREALVIEDDQQGNGAPAVYSREPPLLYGIIIAGAIAVFVTLDSAQAGAVPRTISHFDFDQRTMDVWNGFAIAIMVVSVRNYMISIKEHLEDEEEEDDDPDA